MKRKVLVMAAIIISSQLYAQDSSKVKQLDEVIVTANRMPQKQSSTGKMVTVINQETLQRNAGKTLSEIINYQSGIFINGATNNLGTNPDIYFRGASAGNTLILIDGIPVGDPSNISNTFDLNMIALGQVERVEILKGAQSTLWGSDAVAGVINIITKKENKSGINSTALLSYGSYQTVRGNVGLNGRLNKFSYNLDYDFTNSKGFSTAYDSTGNKNFDNDNFKQNNFQANLRYQFDDHWSIKTLNSFSKYTGGTDAGAFQDDKDNTFENKNDVNNMEVAYSDKLMQLHLSQSFFTASRIYTDDSASVGGFSKYSKGVYHGNTAVTELFGNFKLAKKLVLISGIQRMFQQTDQNYLSISSYGPYKTALGDSAKVTNFAMYHSLLLTGINGFDVEAGFRYNNHSIYGSNATYTFNPSFHVNESAKVFVNISSAFKIPSLYQLYSEYGNKNLTPEKSVNYELGVQVFSKDRGSNIRLAGFKRDIRDLIVFYTDPNTYESKYINRDLQHDYGFELETTLQLAKNAYWINNATYVNGEGENAGVKTKNLYRRPNFTFNSVLNFAPIKGLELMPSVRVVGTRIKGTYDAGPAKMPAYYTIDFYTGYQFSKHCKAFLDLRNITNQQYFDIVGYTSKRFNMMAGVSIGL
ncbi:MAG: TonB-dependent receptor [Bacteroidetes bacterium]|nr:TonB-dependent receptor [Bacteroidota bacterium]